MKILWANPHFLHPTNKGGQIRTLEMLRHLHRWHEIHYVALEAGSDAEGIARATEYSTRSYGVPHDVPDRKSAAFVLQAFGNLFDRLPLAVSRYQSEAMKRLTANLLRQERFDRVVCDFLFAAPNVPCLSTALLFQHNVETTIWQRHLETAVNPLSKAFFRTQADRMLAYEREVCRESAHVVAVSEEDAVRMRKMFGIDGVTAVPTGVDVDYFRPAETQTPGSDLVFIGSMDWLPNIDGVTYFVNEILPLIRRKRPECTVSIVGRKPSENIVEFGRKDNRITVTGTVPDIRPYLWDAGVSIVPLRIGGGTRLKIFEAMAAGCAVVSTTVGAEGLLVNHSENCLIADTPQEFADRCLELLNDDALRSRIALAGQELVASSFSWEQASRCFERILEKAPQPQL